MVVLYSTDCMGICLVGHSILSSHGGGRLKRFDCIIKYSVLYDIWSDKILARKSRKTDNN